MAALLNILLDPRLITVLGVLFFLNLVSLALYRIHFHPLAKFPGPKLAAISRYYEGYYDAWKQGRYIFEIDEMHRKYGKTRYRSCFYLAVLSTNVHLVKALLFVLAPMNFTYTISILSTRYIISRDVGTNMIFPLSLSQVHLALLMRLSSTMCTKCAGQLWIRFFPNKKSQLLNLS